MPRLSDTMEEGTVARWLKHEGDAIHKGEPILEVETDKATMELQAYSDGVLSKILVPEGTTVPLGAPIAVLTRPGEEAAPSAQPVPKEEPKPRVEEVSQRPATVSGGPAALDTTQQAAPVDRQAEAQKERTAEDISEGPPPWAVSPSGAGPAAAPAPAPAERHDGAPLRASPVARRLAEEHHLDLRALAGSGSGPGGRIVQADVERYLREHPVAPAVPQPAPAPAGPEVELRPVSRVHQVMARRMLESATTIPQFYLTTEIDMAAALELRKQLQAVFGEETKISINDLVLRAAALALREVPEVNSSWRDGQLALHKHVHLGFAVAIPDGLLVPVIRDADQKPLHQIAAEARALAAKAREGKLTLAEMSGSTFSVTNLGMFDVEVFQGIINPPEAGLLAVGTVVDKPVAVDGQVVIRPRMRVTLSGDHRAYSGDVGARFLQAFKRLLQEPLRLGF